MTSQTLSPSLISLIQKHNLDISIVEAKSLLNGTRIDAEHYQLDYLDFRKKFDHLNQSTFGAIVERKVTTGHTPSMKDESFYGGDVKFIKTDNLRENEIKPDFSHFLSDKGNAILAKTTLKEGDIIVTIIGATYEIVGRTAMIDKTLLPANINQNVALIRVNPSKVNPYYINVFLNSKYGKLCLHSMARQTEQVNLNCTEIENIPLPLPSPSFQSSIASLVQTAHSEREKSKSLYAEAEKILLDELGLTDWKPTEENIDIKTSEEVRLFGRCDAEFFQPKYDELIENIKKFPHKTISELSSVVGHPSNPPYSDNVDRKEKTYILTQKHLGEFYPRDNFWEDEDALFTTDDFLYNNKKYILRKDDLILYSVGAYIGKTNIYNLDTPAIIGSFVTLIRPKKELIDSYYFMMFMNSWVGIELTRRNQRGLAQQYIYPYDIREQIIPILSPAIQSKISSLIVSSHEARTRSKELLERAKRAVEIFVEEDEETAKKLFDIS